MEQPLTFGEWIRQTRESKRYGVVECARRAGMKHSQWVRLEADEPRRIDGSPPQPTRGTTEKVAAALEVPVNEALHAAGYTPRAAFPQEQSLSRNRKSTDYNADPPAFLAYYNELPENVQEDVRAQIEALWRRHRGDQTTHGKTRRE